MIHYMKVNSLLSGLFLLALIGCAIEDETSPTPDEVFIKYYGSAGSQSLHDMVYNSDGNIVMLADQTLSDLGADANIYLVEADTNGNAIRSNTISLNQLIYPDSAEYHTAEFPSSIVEIATGYVIAGSYGAIIDAQIQQLQGFWMALDNDLQVINWDTVRTGNVDLTINDAIQTSDGNVLLGGSTTAKAVNDLTPAAREQYFLIKRDFNADTTIFRKTYGYSSSDDEVVSIFELSNGDIALIGNTDRIGSAGGSTGKNIGIMILNPLATAQKSAKEYGISINGNNSADDRVVDAIQTSSGFVIVGTSELGNNERAFVLGVSTSSSLIFRSTLESQWGINTNGNSVALTFQNELFVVGSYPAYVVNDDTIDPSFRNKNAEILAMRVDQFGTPVSGVEGNFGVISGDDEANSVIKMPSGSLVVGATVDFGSGQRMLALQKMNDRAILQRP